MLSIAGIWSILELRSIGASVQDLLDDNYKSINAAKLMLEALEREDSGILLLILGEALEGRTMIIAADSSFEKNFQIAAKNLTIPGEQSYIDSIKAKYQTYKELWDGAIADNQKQGNLSWYFQTVHGLFIETKTAVNNLMSANDKVMFQTASDLKNKANRAIMPGIVAILSALIFSALFSFFVNHYVINPIVRITKNIKGVVDRNLPFNVEIETKDELLDLASSIETLCSLAKTSREKQ
jgi:methyl-accepting chemotaxis protein